MELKNKRVAVFGPGISGLAALELLAKKDAHVSMVGQGDPSTWSRRQEVTSFCSLEHCYDQNDPEAARHFASVDLIIISPGIDPTLSCLDQAKSAGVPIRSEIELASWSIQAPIIAITGTNGKTTTTNLIADLLQTLGKKVFVGGNIGTPLSKLVSREEEVDYVVLELSSFQLEAIETLRPHVALVLNITRSHGERYEGLEDYAAAKFNITKNMSTDDTLIYCADGGIVEQWGSMQSCKKVSLPLSIAIEKVLDHFGDCSSFRLVGHHNRINLGFTLSAAEALGLSFTPAQLDNALKRMKAVSYRMEEVEVANNTFTAFNDAKSTNWEATLTALRALEGYRDHSIYLILGGKKRGSGDTITPHLKEIKERVNKIFLIGEVADQLAEELGNEIPYLIAETIDKVIEKVKDENFEGVLLFSPAFPSFDQFLNYLERGRRFEELVKAF